MFEIINSFGLVFIGEMGDKTQLLSLMLVACYKKPWPILAGVFVATLLNHALASWLGEWAASFLAPETLRWVLAVIFFIFAAWILIPDKNEEISNNPRFGLFWTTTFLFFLAEMGDKTQLATVALAAQYSSVLLVTIGSTLGMMASNALAIFMGPVFLKRVPMKWVRVVASLLFLLFGIGILLS